MLAITPVVEWLILALLIILLLMGLGIRSSLRRMESQLRKLSKSVAAPPAAVASAATASAAAASGQESAFETFLAEDPQRLTMSKSEQFAAFRQWRKEKGMSWSDS